MPNSCREAGWGLFQLPCTTQGGGSGNGGGMAGLCCGRDDDCPGGGELGAWAVGTGGGATRLALAGWPASAPPLGQGPGAWPPWGLTVPRFSGSSSSAGLASKSGKLVPWGSTTGALRSSGSLRGSGGSLAAAGLLVSWRWRSRRARGSALIGGSRSGALSFERRGSLPRGA